MNRASSRAASFPHAQAFLESRRFEPSELLGVGASATVYRAWDCERQEHVALKVLHHGDPLSRARYERQIHALSGVEHPSLVRTHGIAALGDKLAIVMALVEGRDFMRYVRADLSAPAFDSERLVSCIGQLVGALSALHIAYFVHRDVKPANLRVTSDARLVLLDLGTAAELSDLEEPGVGVGTPAYMAPEQATGEPIGRAADFYALGVVLYEVLTGVLPHPDAEHRPMVKLVDHVVPVRSLVSTAPQPLSDLTSALLSREPHSRPTSREILARLGLPMNAASTVLPVSIKAPRVLLDRACEREQLRGALERARAGEGCWLHISGEPGAGKSQLVHDLVLHARLKTPPSLVVESSFRTERASAYGAIDVLVEVLADSLSRLPALSHERIEAASWLTRMFPGLLRVAWLSSAPKHTQIADPLLGRMAAESLLGELIRYVAASESLLIVLEDLDTAAPDALRVLETLLRAPLGSTAYVTTASGDSLLDVTSAEVVSLGASTHALRVELVKHMWAQGVCEGEPPLEVAEQAQSARACLELVRARMRGHQANSARDAIAQRIAELPLDTRHVLGLVCTSSVPTSRDLLGVTSMFEGVHIRTHLARLLDHALITRTEDMHGSVVFAPDSAEVVEAMDATLGQAGLASLHFDWGQVLASRAGASSVHAYEHLLRAGEARLAAGQASRAAGEAAKRLAFASAADCAVQAQLLEPTSERERSRLHVVLGELSEALALAGRPREAAEVCAKAITSASSTEALQLGARRTEFLLRAGCLTEGVDSANEVLAAVDLRLSKTVRQALISLSWHRVLLRLRGLDYTPRELGQVPERKLAQIDALLDASSMITSVDPIIGTELLARGLRRALTTGEPRRVVRALLLEASSQAHLERPPFARARALLQRARTMIDATGESALLHEHDECEAFVAFQSFDLRRAAAAYETIIARQAQRANVRDALAFSARHSWMQSLFLLGEFRSVVSAYRDAMRIAQRAGDVQASVAYATLLGACVGVIEDTPEHALRELEGAALPVASQQLYITHAYEIFGRCMLLLYMGDIGAVGPVLERIGRMRTAMFAKAGFLRAMFDLTEAGLRLARAASAHEHCDEDLHIVERLARGRAPYPWVAAEWSRLRAALHLWKREQPAAIEALRLYIAQRTAIGCGTAAGEYALGLLEGEPSGRARCAAAQRELETHGVKDVPRFVRACCAVSGPGRSSSLAPHQLV